LWANLNYNLTRCTLKNLFSIVLLFIFLLQIGGKVSVFVYWKNNRQEIAEKYCENKAKPIMKCFGKCYLNKQLQKLGSNTPELIASQESSLFKIAFASDWYFTQHYSFSFLNAVCATQVQHFKPYLFYFTSSVIYPALQPPEAELA
jgi:cbb3-type cytochrome oxidase subunit 3